MITIAIAFAVACAAFYAGCQYGAAARQKAWNEALAVSERIDKLVGKKA